MAIGVGGCWHLCVDEGFRSHFLLSRAINNNELEALPAGIFNNLGKLTGL